MIEIWFILYVDQIKIKGLKFIFENVQYSDMIINEQWSGIIMEPIHTKFIMKKISKGILTWPCKYFGPTKFLTHLDLYKMNPHLFQTYH